MSNDKFGKIKNKLSSTVVPSADNKGTVVRPVLRDVSKLAAGVASVNTTGTASATGNPRNKCALQPGHSLMDWIRLGASGQDLTGAGAKAGHLAITKAELSQHDTIDDAWLAIRGKVFNVTHYLPFHPGGPEELMKGAGKDATSLFDQIHPWVNYDQILQKCLLGKLVAMDSSVDAEKLFYSNTKTFLAPTNKSSTSSHNHPDESARPVSLEKHSVVTDILVDIENTDKQSPKAIIFPKFDWIQKLDEISIIFYTKPLINPYVLIENEANHPNHFFVNLAYEDNSFSNAIEFQKATEWPCRTKLNQETGKVEMFFKKVERCIWDNFGKLKQSCLEETDTSVFSSKVKYECDVVNKVQVTCNIFLLELKRVDDGRIVVPLGNHIRVFGEPVEEKEISRSYTPVPKVMFSKFGDNHDTTTDTICLMVKRYPDGTMSKYVADAVKGDRLELSNPISGGLDLPTLEKKEFFVMLAAGTGITPMLSVLVFLLERRIRKCQSVFLLFWNRKIQHIPFRRQFDDLTKKDKRFKIEHILSEPDDDWRGRIGYINTEIVRETVENQLKNTSYTKRDIYFLICGPPLFNSSSKSVLQELDFFDSQIHVFQG